MHPVFSRARSRFYALFAESCTTLGACCVLGLTTPSTIAPEYTQTLVQPVVASSEDIPQLPLFSEDITISTSMPDDRFAAQQWSFHSSSQYAGASGLFSSREFLTAPAEVVVAVVDSGVMLNHEDLHFLPGYDFIHNAGVGNDSDGRDHDPSDPGDWVNLSDIDNGAVSRGCSIARSKWHGTAIAGLIGASSHNAIGIAGGAPTVAVLPVRVTGKCGGYVADLIDGIRWSAGLSVAGVADNPHPADVINLSVGFPGQCSNAMQSAINDAVNAGAVVVTASTNSAADLDITPYSPATCNNLLTVAATDRAGAITPYSALGEAVFISAPGGTLTDGIITTQNDGNESPLARSTYGSHYGTSIAAAHVTAAVANLLSYQPDLSANQLKQLLAMSANPTLQDPRCESGQCGIGRLDAYQAIALLAEGVLFDDEQSNDDLTEDTIPVQLAAARNDAAQSTAIVTASSNGKQVGAGTINIKLIAILILAAFIQRLVYRRN